jgi:hypothetical protein
MLGPIDAELEAVAIADRADRTAHVLQQLAEIDLRSLKPGHAGGGARAGAGRGISEGRPRWRRMRSTTSARSMRAIRRIGAPHRVLPPERARRVADPLRQRGADVVAVPFDVETAFGGGLRCWSQPMAWWD